MHIRDAIPLSRLRTRRRVDASAPSAFGAQRWMFAEALVLVALGVAMLGACYSPIPAWIGRCCAGPSGEPPTATAAGLLCTYGVGLLLVGALALCTAHKRSHTLTMAIIRLGVDVCQEFGQAARATLRATRGTEWAGYAVMLLMAGTLLRGYGLSLPVRYDEAFTYLHFVQGGLLAPFHYMIPNNHVLYSLMIKAAVAILGSDPWVLRLPALIAGMGSLVMAVVMARRLLGPASGLATLALMAMHPYVVLYDTMGRGYSLTVLTVLCLVGAGLRFAERPQLARGALVALTASVGHLVMPSFLFATLGVFAWVGLLLHRRGLSGRVLLRCLAWLVTATVLLTFIFYTPVLLVSHGYAPILNNRWTASQSWTSLIWRLMRHARAIWRAYTMGMPSALVVGVACGAVWGIRTLVREKRWTSISLLPACLVAAAVLIIAKRAVPFPRTWLYALPFLFMLVDAGVTGFRSSCRLRWRVFVHVGLLCISLAWGLSTIRHSVLTRYPNLGYIEEMPVAASWLAAHLRQGDRVVARNPVDAPLQYYMKRLSRPPTDSSTPPRRWTVFVTDPRARIHGDVFMSMRAATFGLLAIDVQSIDTGLTDTATGELPAYE